MTRYFALKDLKIGNNVVRAGDEIKNFKFFKPQNKKALINMNRVAKVDDDYVDEFLESKGFDKEDKEDKDDIELEGIKEKQED